MEPFSFDGKAFVSAEDQRYFKYKLGILADDVNFKQQVILPAEADTITVYSVDGLIFCSKVYAEYIMPDTSTLYPFYPKNVN
jgi:acetone carboxylase gamma subunit